MIHPALAPALAGALGISADQVLAIARCVAWLDGNAVHPLEELDTDHAEATGPSALHTALVSAGADASLIKAAVTRSVPVPPPDSRPFCAGLGEAMVDPWIGPLNEAWRVLVLRAQRQLRLIELEAPDIIALNEQRMFQQRFETVLRLTAATPALTRVWPELEASSSAPLLMGAPTRLPEGATNEIVALAFVDERRLFVQRAQGSWLVTTAGETLRHFSTCGRVVTSVHGSRLRMSQWIGDEWDWFDEDGYWQAKSGRSSLAVLDLETNAYLDRYPADLPQRLIDNEQPEDLVAGSVAEAAVEQEEVEQEEGGARGDAVRESPAPLRWGGDRPGVIATTRDARFAWVGEAEDTAVLDVETGIPQIDPVMNGRFDEADPVLRVSPDAEDVRDECDGNVTASALGLTAQSRFRFLHDSGVVSDGEQLWFRIDALVRAAAFNGTADVLALAVDEEILLVSVTAKPIVLARFTAPSTP